MALAVLHSVLELLSPAQVLLIEQNTATHIAQFFFSLLSIFSSFWNLKVCFYQFILYFSVFFSALYLVHPSLLFLFCFLFPVLSPRLCFYSFYFLIFLFFFFKSAFLSFFFFYCFSFMFCYYSICSLSVILHPFRNTSLLSLLLLLLFSVNTFCCKDCMIFMFSHLSLSLLFLSILLIILYIATIFPQSFSFSSNRLDFLFPSCCSFVIPLN